MTDSSDEKDSVQIGFRGTPDYRMNLQREALRRGMKVQHLIEEALEYYLSQSSLPENPTAKNVTTTNPPGTDGGSKSGTPDSANETQESVIPPDKVIKLSKSEEGWVWQLLTILRGDMPETRHAITSNLQAFYLLTKLGESTSESTSERNAHRELTGPPSAEDIAKRVADLRASLARAEMYAKEAIRIRGDVPSPTGKHPRKTIGGGSV